MNTTFPFGFPWPTAFYLTFYLVTLVVYWVFMQYVLAGSAYVVAARVFFVRSDLPRPIDDLLREWLPLMLSGAITAGIAPLLFLQILYQQQFYSANLLLFHRWMAVLPTLIAGFYLLYLVRTKRFDRWPIPIRVGVSAAAFACFAFIAWSWTENHLLSLDKDIWPEHYAAGRVLCQTKPLVPRLLVWLVTAFPTMATIIGWQLWYVWGKRRAEIPGGSRRTSALALGCLLLSPVAIAAYLGVLPTHQRAVVFGAMSLPYTIAGAVGWVVQVAAWGAQYRSGLLSRVWLGAASLGGALTLTGIAVARESLRIAAVDFTSLYQRHASAAKVGGLPVFFVFLAINLGLITLAILLVRRGIKPLNRES
jgi:hypothetical protein